MAIILTERAKTLSLAKTYQERYQLQSVELAAKSELISLSKAIDTAAAKGEVGVIFKLSAAITKLSAENRLIAQEIIEADIRAAGYSVELLKDTKDNLIGYDIGWVESTSDEEDEGGDGSSDEEPAISIATATALDDAINSNEEVVTLQLTDDITIPSTISIEEGKAVTINMNGSTLSNNSSNHMFTVDGGSLIINGDENSNIETPGRIVVVNDGAAEVNGGTYATTSEGQVFSAAGANATLTLNNVEATGQEFSVGAFDGGHVIINGGEYESIDNAVIATNGTAGRGGNTIELKGVKLTGNITSDGYEACGIYVANNDTVIIDGDCEITSSGCGILMRGGNVIIRSGAKITTTGDPTATGWVGDNKTKMSNAAIIYHETANYPGKAGMSLIVEPGVIFNVTGKKIEILSNEETPNVTAPAEFIDE